MPSGCTILVVDDHPDTRDALALLLTAAGYVVRTAEDGATALELLQLHPECGLVLLDWRLPDMNGGDVLRALRVEPELTDVPVIVLSADGLVAEEVREAGGTAFLHKPQDADVLLAVIARHLQAREQSARP
jgi:CheY-like chemotaxis protein